jgi:hypothetical protein
MRKISIAAILFATVIIFQFCSSSKKTVSAKPAAISYETTIKPVIEANLIKIISKTSERFSNLLSRITERTSE